jgi:dihydroorotase
MKTLIKNATLVNKNQQQQASVLIDGDFIVDIFPSENKVEADLVIDATNKFLIPGAIDTHVHFREPGLTHKADFTTESTAAVAGGVTTVMDMPNNIPATTDRESLEIKELEAQKKCYATTHFTLG